ncbi:hypothetical protein LOAG_11951, partial [Loa loa]
MYRPLGAHQKDISTRLMKPTCPDIRIKDVLHLVKNWNPAWEFDGDITVFDAGIAQYLLADDRSHDVFLLRLYSGSQVYAVKWSITSRKMCLTKRLIIHLTWSVKRKLQKKS